MSCQRCGGLMVIEPISDLGEEAFRTRVDPIRCLNCGNFEDGTIRSNRAISCVPRLVELHTGRPFNS
jgi:hypothetical protein